MNRPYSQSMRLYSFSFSLDPYRQQMKTISVRYTYCLLVRRLVVEFDPGEIEYGSNNGLVREPNVEVKESGRTDLIIEDQKVGSFVDTHRHKELVVGLTGPVESRATRRRLFQVNLGIEGQQQTSGVGTGVVYERFRNRGEE